MNICRGRMSVLRPGQLVTVMASSHADHLSLTVLQVAPAVDHLTVTTSRGHTFRVLPVGVGNWRYCVVPADDNDPDISWTAYDPSGGRLGAGSARGW
jgi:hypothetical protein